MNIKNNYSICEQCKYSELLFCKKYNKECVSINLNNNRYEIACEECLVQDSYTLKADNNIINIGSNKACFHIPDLTILDNIILLLKKQKQFSYAFYPNRIITEVYDAFPGAIWNGRTPLFNRSFLSIQQINEIKEKLEKNNLSLNLTWNNHLIKEHYLYDTYSNNVTELFNNGLHSITVASDDLLLYLKKNYPNYTFYQSHIRTEKNYELLFSDNYDIIIAPKKLNNNWEALNLIDNTNRNKIEFLCNDACFPDCNKNIHYESVNQHLLLNCYESIENTPYCKIDQTFKFYNTQRWSTTINPKDIDLYLNNNFLHFKLASRGDSKEILLYKICKYLVKPEYFEDIYFSILGGNNNNELYSI